MKLKHLNLRLAKMEINVYIEVLATASNFKVEVRVEVFIF